MALFSKNCYHDLYTLHSLYMLWYLDRVTELWDYPKYGCPKKHGSKYFYFHNSGLQNQR